MSDEHADCYAAITGGSSAILPRLLAGFGYRGRYLESVRRLALPGSPAAGGFAGRGAGGGATAIARPPLDAEPARQHPGDCPTGSAMPWITIMWPCFQLAHYAGGASRWHGLLRRIGGWSRPGGHIRDPDAAGGRTPARRRRRRRSSPTRFRSTLPGDGGAGSGHCRQTIRRPSASEQRPSGHGGRGTAAGPLAVGSLAAQFRLRRPSRGVSRWLPGGSSAAGGTTTPSCSTTAWYGSRPHPRTGGLLSLRRPGDRGNRISQQLALRTTTAAGPGHGHRGSGRATGPMLAGWRPSDPPRTATRAGAAREPGPTGDGSGPGSGPIPPADAAGVPGCRWPCIDIEVTPRSPLGGPLLGRAMSPAGLPGTKTRMSNCGAACICSRWSPNAPGSPRRISSRSCRRAARRRRRPGDAVAILTGGLPWHLLSSPHVLDSILLTTGARPPRRLAVGVGTRAALGCGGRSGRRRGARAGACGCRPTCGSPATAVRAGHAGDAPAAGRPRSNRRGRGGRGADRVGRPSWPGRRRSIFEGRPLPEVHVGGCRPDAPRCFCKRYQWLHLELEFAGAREPAVRENSGMIVTLDGPAGAGKSTGRTGPRRPARLVLSRHRRDVSHRRPGGPRTGTVA